MYYPIKWHKVLKLDLPNNSEKCNILSIQPNQERELFFILTNRSLHLWYSRPVVEIVSHKRSDESIESLGYNKYAVWKTDSNVIVVGTERSQLLFFHVRRRFPSSTASTLLFPSSNDSDNIYRLRCDAKSIDKVTQHNQDLKKLIDRHHRSQFETIPALTVHSFGKLDLSHVGISCLMSAEEELVIAACNGEIYGVHWNGNVDEKFPWTLSKDVPRGSDFVIDLKFSSVLSGFALIFNSGRVAFLSSKPNKSDNSPNEPPVPTDSDTISRLKFLTGIDKASCADMNHRYRLVAIGLCNSEVLVCNVNDFTSSLVINHKLKLQDNKYPFDLTKLGSVHCIRYSPDCAALVSCWDNGEFAIWSVFGSLLFCSLQWKLETSIDNSIKLNKITSVAWSQEGYNIWMSIIKDESTSSIENGHLLNGNISGSMDENDLRSTTSSQSETSPNEEVVIIPLTHSNLLASPHLTCSSDCIVLISEDCLHIGPSVPHRAEFDHWFVIDIPQHYLNSNYPIRYASVDRQCKNVAIAGNRGLALYSIEHSEWKFLSKSSYADSFSVCGDMIWWNDFIIASTYSLVNESFELRAYITTNFLERESSVIQATTMEVIRMSIFENRLLVLYSDGTLGMFMLNLKIKPNLKKLVPSGLQISPIENLIISNLQANAYCIASIALTRLHFKNNRVDDSIILNACGKLFLLEREVPPELSTPSPTTEMTQAELRDLSLESNRSSEIELKVKEAKRLSDSVYLASASLKNKTVESNALSNVTFKAVSVIATNVEQFWISPEISDASDMSYFKKSLWLSCGGSNNQLQVWLPLLNDKNDPPTDLYVPDRIMLPIKCDIYPLAVRSSTPDDAEPDAIVLGAENDILYSDIKLLTYFPYSAVKRQCRVYLHRILRELLLNQHLGYYARKIAESCQSLPYFAHSFELLLHEVLEEEATSPVPLPDPMLPQIVRFIKEFPVYYETVVHCARKSELFMWSHLFDERAVGNPRRLFQECLERNKLDTAASCLIILQSLDRNIVSQRMVSQLIQSAKEDKKFNYLVQDLENFLTRAELDLNSSS